MLPMNSGAAEDVGPDRHAAFPLGMAFAIENQEEALRQSPHDGRGQAQDADDIEEPEKRKVKRTPEAVEPVFYHGPSHCLLGHFEIAVSHILHRSDSWRWRRSIRML